MSCDHNNRQQENDENSFWWHINCVKILDDHDRIFKLWFRLCSHISFNGLLILQSLKCICDRGTFLLSEIGIHKKCGVFKFVQNILLCLNCSEALVILWVVNRWRFCHETFLHFTFDENEKPILKYSVISEVSVFPISILISLQHTVWAASGALPRNRRSDVWHTENSVTQLLL